MPSQLMLASAAITFALALYTVGVFTERHDARLSIKHVALFWCGLVFDTTGTTIMTGMAQAGASSTSPIHGITGAAAIVLMLFHAAWATVTLLRKNRSQEQTFHRFSTAVWLLWLIPYLIGLMVGVPFITLGDAATVVASTGIAALIALALALSDRAAKVRRAPAAGRAE